MRTTRRRTVLRALRSTIACGTLVFGWCATADAQQSDWRPTRLPATTSSARPLPSQQPTPANVHSTNQRTAYSANKTSGQSANEHLGSGVVLRWKNVGSSNSDASLRPAANSNEQVAAQPTYSNSIGGGQSSQSQFTASMAFDNPLRSQSTNRSSGAAVRTASYVPQDTAGDALQVNPLAPSQDLPPVLPNTGAANGLPALPPQQGGTQQGDIQQGLPELPSTTDDPLQDVEMPPPPAGGVSPRVNPFPSSGLQDEFSPSNAGVAGQDGAAGDQDLDMPNRDRERETLSCNEQRDRVRNRPLTQVSLDVSPSYGEGLRSVKKDTTQQKLEFAQNSELRQWYDYRGEPLELGRMIDLKDDHVVLDVDGQEKKIPLQVLSDVDAAYVGESWNIPLTCGIGFDSYAGRSFIPSSVQWKAPGQCHKPFYFEQIQLERYGHEIGPVLQPMVSTAHFFTNIAVLPYKMGIHPPNECQYSLGYHRPGNCAPYMLQPIPWSLRGAAVQAAAVTGAAALIP